MWREKVGERRTDYLHELVIGDSVFILSDWIGGIGCEDHFQLIGDLVAGWLR